MNNLFAGGNLTHFYRAPSKVLPVKQIKLLANWKGDSASARASLTAIENSRAARGPRDAENDVIRIQFRTFGLCCALENLGIGILLNRTNKERVRLMLRPWIIEAALARLTGKRLSADEQRTVLESTTTPEKVRWPAWWSVQT